jgi:hypothetical protein
MSSPARVAVVAVAGNHQVHGFSSVTGALATLAAPGLTNTDRVVAAGDVAIVAVAANHQVLGFSAVTGAWTHTPPPV